MPRFHQKPLEGYFPALDGLRGLSILLVMLNHFTIPLPSMIEFVRNRGHLGVEVFFAVSGFLVTRSLHICWVRSEGQLWPTLYEFYVRRLARILFPYLLTLCVIFLLSLLVGSLHQKLESVQDILYSFFIYSYNYAKFSTEGTVPGALNIMWSLSFEEQFYVFLGILFAFFHWSLDRALVFFALLSLLLRFVSVYSVDGLGFNHIQFQTHMRLDAIVWGCVLYLYWESIVEFFKANALYGYVILFGVLVAFYFGSSALGLFWVAVAFSLTAIFFSLMIVYVQVFPLSWVSRLFKWSFMVFVGRISYEIYLSHQLINGFIMKLGVAQYSLVYVVLLVGSSVSVSWLFFRFVNQPIQAAIRERFIGKV